MVTVTLPLSKKDLVESSTAPSNTTAILDSSQISKALFYFTSYSFTGAAIMGSSVGLVVYQSRQFKNLNRADHFSRQYTQPSYPSSTFPEASPSYPSPPAVTGTPFFTSFVSWLPYLVWILSLFATSFFVRRTWIPKQISPRTGILASQVLFGVVWVLLGSVQEALEIFVQDRNHRLDSYAVAPADDVNDRDPGSLYSKAGQLSTLDQNSLHNMYSMTPLCIVWYGAIVAIGVATGLLTTSSAICEQHLIHKYNDRMAQEREISKEQRQLDEAVVDIDQDLTVGVEQHASYRCSTHQKVLLALWVLILMWAQLQFFRWVMSSRSVDIAAIGVSSLSSATCMTMFSLFTSVVMFMVGVRILPTP
ncbi:hypothetical protein BG000_002274 [Podila horticola]|nr:hypothetical protein BG000_002274 [Podila horticola]